MVLNQAKSQVGQGDEPAEVILCHDLCGVRAPGVVRHVIDGRVGHKVVHGVAARSRRHREGLVRALDGGEEVQAERLIDQMRVILHFTFLIFYTFLRVNFACKNYTFACKFWGVNYTRWGVNYTPRRVNYTRIFCELHSVSVHFQLDFPHVCGAFEPKQHPPLSQNSIRLYSIAYIGLCFFCFL